MKFKLGNTIKKCGRLGKVTSLPQAIRTEINRRLDDGQRAPEIAAWINTLDEVRKIVDEKWRGKPVNASNVNVWRRAEYQQWLRQREKLENLKALSEYALKLGQATGGSIVDGSAAIVGGRILSELETATGEEIHRMVRSISQLRSGEINQARLRQSEQKLELDRKRYQRQTTELFVKWYADHRARAIVESRDNNAEKIELLGRAMFGEDW